MENFYEWWTNHIHGNYIENEQFDRIVNNTYNE